MSPHDLPKILAIATVFFATPVSAQSNNAWDTGQPANLEFARQQLFDLTQIHQSMVETYELLGGDAPHLRLAIQREQSIIAKMTVEELQVLVESGLPMDEINSQLAMIASDMRYQANAAAKEGIGSQFYFAPSSNADPAPQTAGASHLEGSCPADDQILSKSEAGRTLPRGPCNQSDDIPVEFNPDDGTRVLAEFRLSDVDYPFICPINTPAAIIVGYEVTFNILNFLAKLAKRSCDQEAAGFNVAAACIPFVAGVGIANEILGFPKYCNGVRRNSDGTAIYVRTGEIFVQSNAHYEALDARSSETSTKIDDLEADVSNEVTRYGSEVSAEIQAGFGAIDDQMAILEQRIRENQELTDFTRLNNDEIVREIRIQKARILGDLPDN